MFNKRLQRLRKSRQLTQDELANRLSINRGTYANYERGHRQPDFDTLVKIADFFEVTTDYLLGREEKINNVEQASLFTYEQLGISLEDYEALSTYQQEVLEWAASPDGPMYKGQSEDPLEMINRLEIAYEVYQTIKKREKNT